LGVNYSIHVDKNNSSLFEEDLIKLTEKYNAIIYHRMDTELEHNHALQSEPKHYHEVYIPAKHNKYKTAWSKLTQEDKRFIENCLEKDES
jgi:hypothetical protein